MTTDQKTDFEERYAHALRLRLRRTSSAGSSRAARHLGAEAIELGMGIKELVSLHHCALSGPDEGNGSAKRERNPSPSPSTSFLLEALTSHERSAKDAQDEIRNARESASKRLEDERERYGALLAESQLVQDEARQLAHQFLLAQEEDRKEISRELHDEVLQILAGINVRLAALKRTTDPDALHLGRDIDQSQQLVARSIEVVHSFARKLRPPMLDDLGLIPSLRSFIKNLPHDDGLRIRLRAIPEVESLPPLQRMTLYRVAQEALTNTVRHAEARNASITITKNATSVRLVARDDGKSFPVERVLASNVQNRLGLVGMRERVEIAGGAFAIRSSPGNGTAVSVDIPTGALEREPEA